MLSEKGSNPPVTIRMSFLRNGKLKSRESNVCIRSAMIIPQYKHKYKHFNDEFSLRPTQNIFPTKYLPLS